MPRVTNLLKTKTMDYPDYVDAEMRELLDELGAAIVPRNRRRPVYRTNWHAPYYSRKRYARV